LAIVTIGDFDPGGGQTAAEAQRRGRALLRWVNAPDVRNVFFSIAVTEPQDVEAFVAMWEAARTIAPRHGLPASASSAITNLPVAATARAQSLLQTDQFRTQYQPFGVSGIGSVELADLIAPEMWVDEEFVDELVGQLPADGAENALFDFCFPNGRLEPPMPVGTNGASFTSHRRHIGGLTPVRVADYSPDRVTFEFDVIPRPNWLSVGIIESGGVVIRNGVHHALALLKAGRQRGFFLLQSSPAGGLGLDYQNPGIFKPNQFLAARPPLLRDYLDDELAVPVATRTMDQYFKYVIISDGGLLPRPSR
jgi:hypothetical protein